MMIWSTVCGSYTIYAIEDGYFLRAPLEQFPSSDPAVWESRREWLIDGQLRLSVGCFLLTNGSRNVLVDAGIGSHAPMLGPDAVGGRLLQALAMLEIHPDSIDTVIHTHLHIDHCGGDRTADGELLFPGASFWIHRAELDHWTLAENPMAEAARRVLATIGDHLNPIERETEVAPGITAVETPGHTPGHISIAITSGSNRAFITGDVTHHPAQVEYPDWAIPFDVDREGAIIQRRRVLDRLEGSGSLLAAGHYPRPGMGYVEVLDRTRLFIEAVPVQVA